MAVVPTFAFDDSLLKEFRKIQRQYDELCKNGTISALTQLQKELAWASKIETRPSIEALNNMSQSMKVICTPKAMDMLMAAQRMSEALTPLAQKLMAEQGWVSTMIPSIDTSLREAVACSWTDLACDDKENALLSILENYDEAPIHSKIDAGDVQALTESEKAELASDIHEAVSDNQNWQQRLMAEFQKWKTRNPIVAVIIVWLISTYILPRVIAWAGQTVKSAIIREEPNVNSAMVSRVDQAHNVVVVDDVPYYYYVEFNDPETGAPLCGYISKKSVCPLNSDADNLGVLDFVPMDEQAATD